MSTPAITPDEFMAASQPKLTPEEYMRREQGGAPGETRLSLGSPDQVIPPQGFGWGSAMKRFTGNLGQGIGVPERLGDYVAGPTEMVSHPIESAKLLNDAAAGAQGSLWQKAKNAWSTPESGWWPTNKIRGAAYGIYSALPFVGPALAKSGEQLERGDVAGSAGTVGALAAPVGAPKALGAVGDIAGAAMDRLPPFLGRETMTRPRGTTPAEMASPQELLRYARDNGIPVNAAQVTEHNLPRNLQSVGERATIGGTAVRRQTMTARAAVARNVEQMAEQMAPRVANTADAGAALKQSIQSAKEQELANSREYFQAVDRDAKGVAVDMRPLKQLADQIFSDSDFIRANAKSMDPKHATSVLGDVRKMPDRASFGDAQKLRSSLFQESSHPDNVISEEAQAWMKRLTAATDDQMMTAAANNPALEQAFRKANGHWRQLQEDFNNQRSPLYQALKETTPEKIPQKFLQKGQTGGSPSTVGMLQRYGIDAGPLKRELLMDLAEGKFVIKGTTLSGYDHDFLSALFSPEELNAVYNTAALGRSTARNTNTSGTGEVMGAMHDVTHPTKSLMPKFVAAKLTNSPGFNRLLTGQPGPGAISMEQAVEMGGPEPPETGTGWRNLPDLRRSGLATTGKRALLASPSVSGVDEDYWARYLRSLP